MIRLSIALAIGATKYEILIPQLPLLVLVAADVENGMVEEVVPDERVLVVRLRLLAHGW